MFELTILTEPVSRRGVIKKIKAFIKMVVFLQPKKKYGGHYAVTRSLVEGLRKLNYNFNCDPKNINDISEKVIVLSGVETLRQAIELKKNGKIKKLLAGPNIIVSPEEYDKILCSPEIDICIVPSEWVRAFYESVCPELIGRVKSWPAGVNGQFFNPIETSRSDNRVLFYNKRPDTELFDFCKKVCVDNGFIVEVIDYGKHSINYYKKALSRSCFLVHFVEQESQGISLLESWAMDVPTFVWSPKTWVFNGRCYNSSSAPYLSDKTGKFFYDKDSFVNLIKNGLFDRGLYNPRKWVLVNLTDEKSAKKLLIILND